MILTKKILKNRLKKVIKQQPNSTIIMNNSKKEKKNYNKLKFYVVKKGEILKIF